MINITIRKAIEEDAVRIHELHINSARKICSTVYSPEIIDGWLEKRTPGGYLAGIQAGEMYVAEIRGKIVGFGHAVPGEIEAIYVDPAYARQGVGTALMSHGLKMANVKAPGVIRLQSTLNARPFYESMGFRFVKEITLRRNTVDIPCYEMHRAGDAI
jgi:putative acetyltransferase